MGLNKREMDEQEVSFDTMPQAKYHQFAQLCRRLSSASNEEEVRLAWVRALETTLGIEFDAERSKRDLSYNNVIIEFKGPGKFNGKTTSSAFREALYDRLLPYILRMAKKEPLDASDYIGIAIDDSHLAFAQVIDGEITHQNLLPITGKTFGMVVEACRRCHRRAVTATNLIEDFGHESSRGIALMRAMSEALAHAKSHRNGNKIRMIFEEWQTLYGQVADLSKEQLKSVNDTMRFSHANNSTEVPEQLFVVHTFNSLLAKLLAAEIVVAHGLASSRAFAGDLVAIEDDSELLRTLQNDIEGGGLFEATGIYGFVEEVIFSWYLDAATNKHHRSAICTAIRDVLTELALYRTDKLDHSRDVLRDFYEDLVPELLRKALGEFYTPDWLVEFTSDQAGVSDWTRTRVLDPTCGSGAFLVEMIRRKRGAAGGLRMSAESTVRMITESVWGFDLNPLAVQVSRTNFLMAIADLLKETPGQQIEIPVLLADAVYSPARLPNSEESLVEYQIGSQIANLKVLLPAELAFDRTKLDQVFELMGELVEENADYEDCETALAKRQVLGRQQLSKWAGPLKGTYEQVLNLHRQSWNGIWFRIVRNFFWSATAGEFDLIVGNPPWVRWSKLPDAYRDRVKPTCEQYEIFSETPHYGGNELDVSGMITYTTADKWLKPGGTLAFVITQTHFQSPSSQGFRRFRIDSTYRLVPLSVTDMKALKPFPKAVNKTSVVVFRKATSPPQYPIPYRIWTASEDKARAIPPTLSIEVVKDRIEVQDCEANPVGLKKDSPWAILPLGRFAAFSRVRGRSTWVQGRKGITTDLNAVYFVPVEASNKSTSLVQIATRPGVGRTDIGSPRSFWVEPTLLYPLLKGAADFEACYLKPCWDLFTFVPNDSITKKAYEDAEHRMNTSYPKTKSYFKAYERWLRRRSSLKRMASAPFYAIYNVGCYTFAPYKVIWAEQSRTFKAAVATTGNVPLLGKRPYVPDHKIFFVAFQKAAPAYFLCGLLNSSIVREFIESHNISIQVGNIFKHMKLPTFDSSQQAHRQLAHSVENAHQEHDETKRAALVDKLRDEATQIIEAMVE